MERNLGETIKNKATRLREVAAKTWKKFLAPANMTFEIPTGINLESTGIVHSQACTQNPRSLTIFQTFSWTEEGGFKGMTRKAVLQCGDCGGSSNSLVEKSRVSQRGTLSNNDQNILLKSLDDQLLEGRRHAWPPVIGY